MTTWIKYVPHNLVADYESKGWVLRDPMQDCHHGNYAVIMVWIGDGEPPMPETHK